MLSKRRRERSSVRVTPAADLDLDLIADLDLMPLRDVVNRMI